MLILFNQCVIVSRSESEVSSNTDSTPSLNDTVNPLITTFVITAKFVITSIGSEQKSATRVFFH